MLGSNTVLLLQPLLWLSDPITLHKATVDLIKYPLLVLYLEKLIRTFIWITCDLLPSGCQGCGGAGGQGPDGAHCRGTEEGRLRPLRRSRCSGRRRRWEFTPVVCPDSIRIYRKKLNGSRDCKCSEIFMKFCCGVLNLSNLLLQNSWLVLINSFCHPLLRETLLLVKRHHSEIGCHIWYRYIVLGMLVKIWHKIWVSWIQINFLYTY